MSELMELLDDFSVDPSNEERCQNVLRYFYELPRYRMEKSQLDDFIAELERVDPKTDTAAEHIDQIHKAVSDYEERIMSDIGSITKGLHKVTDALEGVIYSKEDFDAQLWEIEHGRSERAGEINKLYRMIDSYNKNPMFKNKIGANITLGELLDLDEKLETQISPEILKKITFKVEVAGGVRTPNDIEVLNAFYRQLIEDADVPKADKMETLLREHILQECRNYPQPSERMLQIVNYMTGKTELFKRDRWDNDSLRLRILKQFIKYGNCLMYYHGTSKRYIVKGKPELQSYVQKRYKESGEKKEQGEISNQMILEKIDEQVFDVIEVDEIKKSILSAASRLDELRKQKKGKKYTDIEDEIKKCIDYPETLREEAVDYYLERVWKKFSLSGFSPKKISDYIIHDIYKDNVKPDGTWEILRAADDLAKGRFGENTKRYLYLFAMVFGMTYRNTNVPNYRITDAELNLFEKFYVDEPQRYLNEDLYESDIADGRENNRKDMPPSGRGINRKNFKEIIYLYFIHKPFEKQEELVNKVIDSDKMIRRVENPKVFPVTARRAILHDGEGKESDLFESERENLEKIIAECTVKSDIHQKGKKQSEVFSEEWITKLVHEKEPGEGTVRLKILRRFIRSGNFMEYESFTKKRNVKILGGQKYIKSYAKNLCRKYGIKKWKKDLEPEAIASLIDDAVFGILFTDGASRESYLPGGDYEMLCVADDLAHGIVTKMTGRNRYLFAIVFDLEADTFQYIGEEDKTFEDMAYLRSISMEGSAYEKLCMAEQIISETRKRHCADMGKLTDALVKNFDAGNSAESFKLEKGVSDRAFRVLRLRILRHMIRYADCLVDAEIPDKKSRGPMARGKDFIWNYAAKKGNVQKDAVCNMTPEETAALIEDDIFDLIYDADPRNRGNDKKFLVLQIADDLAGGRISQSTKWELYLYALTFGMRYFVSKNGKMTQIDSAKDVERHLFSGLQMNAVRRYLSGQTGESHAERELKTDCANAGELVCLYLLSHAEIRYDRNSICNVLHEAKQMMDHVRKIQEKRPNVLPNTKKRISVEYQRELCEVREESSGTDAFSRKSMWEFSESEFENVVHRNYNTNPQTDPDDCRADQYQNQPLPDRFMEALVNGLTAGNPAFRDDAWGSDTLRLRILKQFIKYGNFMVYSDGCTECRILCGKDTILRYVQEKTGRNSRELPEPGVLVDLLDERIFDLPDKEKIISGLKSAVKSALNTSRASETYFQAKDMSADAVLREIQDPACRVICDYKIGNYKLAEILVAQIEKRRTQQGKLSLEDIDEEIREIVNDVYETEIIPDRQHEMLIAANDLASGRIRVENQRYLYQFAMIYDMTWHTVPRTGRVDINTDIEVQLFEKYASNCEQSFFEEGAEDSYGKRPVMDFGDFSVIVYLYYLEKDMDRQMKLEKADRMIRRISGQNRQQGSIELFREKEDQVFASRTDEECEEAVRKNYNCCQKAYKLIEIEPQQNSAYREYQFYMIALYDLAKSGGINQEYLTELRWKPDLLNQHFQKIAKEGSSGKWLDEDKKEWGIGIEMSCFGSHEPEDYEAQQPSEGPPKEYEGFAGHEPLVLARRVTGKSDQMIGSCFPMIMKPEKMNRNSLLGVYYYCYNLWNFKYEHIDDNLAGFEGVSEDFIKGRRGDVFLKGADAVLEEAGYKGISRNNLLDFLILFSIYEKYQQW